jgi:4-amino-4-deoxy-L-arabinose transferase-like glycosyltransferase
MSERARKLTLVLLLTAAVVPYFVGLGDSAIWDANEAFYVETPREMIERGDYISPTFNYEPRFNKPVLSYWIVAAFYTLFGVSVGVQRLPIALAAVGLILTALLLAWLTHDETGDGGRSRVEAALWAAIGLAISPRLLMFARRIFIDMYTSLFMGLTLLCFAASERYPERRRVFLALMYVFVGLGVLTKGPVAAVLPALVFAMYLAVHRESRRAAAMMLPAGAAIVLAIVVPWYAALYARDGWAPIVSFFVGENVDRFTSGLGVSVTRGPLFYVPVVFSDSFPWALLLVPAAVAWWRDRQRVDVPAKSRRGRTLLWLWILVIVGFFSLSAGKQDLYIFPIVPAIAALAGSVLARATASPAREQTPVARTAGAIAAVLLIVGAGLIYLVRAAGAAYAIDGLALVGGIGLLTGAIALWLAGTQRIFAAGATLAAGFVALNAVFVLRTLPSFEAYKPVPAFAAAIHARAAPADVIATYDQALPSLVFYLRRHVEQIVDAAELGAILASGKGVFAVMSSTDYELVSSQAPGPLCVLHRQSTFDVRLKNVLAREPPPELVLVTNRCENR